MSEECERLSIITGEKPACASATQICDQIYPNPPVTRTLGRVFGSIGADVIAMRGDQKIKKRTDSVYVFFVILQEEIGEEGVLSLRERRYVV